MPQRPSPNTMRRPLGISIPSSYSPGQPSGQQTQTAPTQYAPGQPVGQQTIILQQGGAVSFSPVSKAWARIDALVALPDGSYRAPIAGQLKVAAFLVPPGIPQDDASLIQSASDAARSGAEPSWACGSAFGEIVGNGTTLTVADGSPAMCAGGAAERCVIGFSAGQGLEVLPKGFTFPLLSPVSMGLKKFDLVQAQSVVVLVPSSETETTRHVLLTRGIARAYATAWKPPMPYNFPATPPSAPRHVGDEILEIPAREIATVEENWAFMRSVLSEIPWFRIGSYDLMVDCAGNVDVATLRDGRGSRWDDPRMYAPSLSAYFPKSKPELHAALATAIGASLEKIFACVASSVEVKAERAERKAKWAAVAGAGIAFGFGLFGLGFPSPGLVANAVAQVFPEYANWIGIVAKVMDVAVGAMGGLGGAVTGLAQQASSGMISKMGDVMFQIGHAAVADSGKKLMEAALSLQTIEAQSAPFILWTVVAPQLGPVIAMGSSLLGYDLDLRKDVIDPLVEKAAASGMALPDYLMQMAAENVAKAEEAKAAAEPSAVDESDTEDSVAVASAIAGSALLAAYFSGIL